MPFHAWHLRDNRQPFTLHSELKYNKPFVPSPARARSRCQACVNPFDPRFHPSQSSSMASALARAHCRRQVFLDPFISPCHCSPGVIRTRALQYSSPLSMTDISNTVLAVVSFCPLSQVCSLALDGLFHPHTRVNEFVHPHTRVNEFGASCVMPDFSLSTTHFSELQ